MRTFTVGAIYAVPNAANPTPVPVASLKGFKATVKQEKKKYRGNQRDIIDVGDGARDWDIEIQSADFRASAFSLVAGGSTATGANQVAIGEQQTLTAGAFTVTNGGTFVEDGGVLDLTAGKWLTRVASAPTTGQYSGPTVAGVYTTAAADNGHIVMAVYTYSSASLGQTTTVNNSIQSQSTAYKLRAYNPWTVGGQSRLIGLEFPSVHFPELDLDFKVEDFATHGLKGFATQDMIGTSLLTCKFYSSELG